MADANEMRTQATPDDVRSQGGRGGARTDDGRSSGTDETARTGRAGGVRTEASQRAGGPLLAVRDLRCGYGKRHPVEIVHGVSLELDPGEFLCIVGPNGCGKTTTLKAMMGLIPRTAGTIDVAGHDVGALSERELARWFAYIPQAHTPPFPFTVADVVMMGRTPYVNRLARTTDHDRIVALHALDLLGIRDIADRPYTQLSGGQQQMTLIARALTQQSAILVMDEPTASLDFGNQQLVLSRMRLLSQMGKAVIMVTHDPDHALFCADRVVVMEEGRVIQTGTPHDCITPATIRRIYRTEACVTDVEVAPGVFERACIPVRAGAHEAGRRPKLTENENKYDRNYS